MSTETRQVVEQLYEAFTAGDTEAVLATFSDDISFRFLGQVNARGIDEARRYFAHQSEQLNDLDFRIQRTMVNGRLAAVLWEESASTASGERWENHGVDVFEVEDGKIVTLHENNDVSLVHDHLAPYQANEFK